MNNVAHLREIVEDYGLFSNTEEVRAYIHMTSASFNHLKLADRIIGHRMDGHKIIVWAGDGSTPKTKLQAYNVTKRPDIKYKFSIKQEIVRAMSSVLQYGKTVNMKRVKVVQTYSDIGRPILEIHLPQFTEQEIAKLRDYVTPEIKAQRRAARKTAQETPAEPAPPPQPSAAPPADRAPRVMPLLAMLDANLASARAAVTAALALYTAMGITPPTQD